MIMLHGERPAASAWQAPQCSIDAAFVPTVLSPGTTTAAAAALELREQHFIICQCGKNNRTYMIPNQEVMCLVSALALKMLVLARPVLWWLASV